MRPKDKPRPEHDRRVTKSSSRRNQAKAEAEAKKVAGRLLVTLYRMEGSSLTITLSEMTLYRLEGMYVVPKAERESELQASVLAHLDGYGIVNRRVVRRQEDRLCIIKDALAASIAASDIELTIRRRGAVYCLSERQMKLQARADKARLQRAQARREERSGPTRSEAKLARVRTA